jgi:methyl-accepting chemotaxis protein
MIPGKYLSTPRSTRVFMLCSGLVLGLLFLLYSASFFGGQAFGLLHLFGCLIGGLLAGAFFHAVLKQALQINLAQQEEKITPLAGDAGEISDQPGMAMDVSSFIAAITPCRRQLAELSQRIADGNRQQDAKNGETLSSAEEMNAFFSELLKEIEELAARTDERASISAEMSATTDAIAENIKEYSTAVLETSASIEEMSYSVKETSASVEALASSTAQTASSIYEIGATIAEVRDNSRKTTDCSEKVRDQAREGIETMAVTIAAMVEIEKISNVSFGAIKQLSLHTDRVGEFLNVIKDVVDQTNLLSLNASIIAAQAGERGKSFAVVAEEVRSLARRTAASTKEIEDLVKNIQRETAAVEHAVTQGRQKVAEGVRISAGTDEALHRIEESAAEASMMVRKIAAATEEQASGSKLIAEEAEKNLERVRLATKAFQEQERGIGLIVRNLDQISGLSQKITTSAQEQARGNRLYLKSVMEDNEKVKKFQEMCMHQIMMGDVLLNSVREAGALVEKRSEEAQRLMAETETLDKLTGSVQTDLAQ